MELKNLQTELQKAITTDGKVSSSFQITAPEKLGEKGAIQVYATGYVARLTEALGATFEAVWWCVGDEDFFTICRDYVTGHPSFVYNINEYGQSFPEFLSNHPAASAPYLTQLAQFEWDHSKIFHAASEASVDATAFATALATTEPTKIRLSLASPIQLKRYEYAVYDVWKASRVGDQTVKLNWEKPQSIVMWKLGHEVQVEPISNEAWVAVEAIGKGESLNNVLEKLFELVPDLSPEKVKEVFNMLGSGLCRIDIKGL